MPKKQVSKSGIPFIIFLIVVTVLVGAWFLRMGNKATDEIVNLSISQNQTAQQEEEEETSQVVEEKDNGDRVFENLKYNFSLNLSEKEAIKEESSASIYTVYFDSNKLSILDEDMESAVKGAILVQSEKEISVNGVKGTEIVATSNKDGSQTNLILIKKDGKLFHFQGTNEFLTKIKTEFFFEN
ncbi:hypothetical protein KKB10_05800 [Patescibacteria group bacterium]|nr:hypothetical protein [Patescibacteria group bacterium]MBU1952350.1 hypothetical protein [Patescibacteria group bacterium]